MNYVVFILWSMSYSACLHSAWALTPLHTTRLINGTSFKCFLSHTHTAVGCGEQPGVSIVPEDIWHADWKMCSLLNHSHTMRSHPSNYKDYVSFLRSWDDGQWVRLNTEMGGAEESMKSSETEWLAVYYFTQWHVNQFIILLMWFFQNLWLLCSLTIKMNLQFISFQTFKLSLFIFHVVFTLF